MVLLLAACASTTLSNSWVNPEYKGPPLKKVMVVGVSSQPALRRTFEDEIVEELKAVGVEAVASYNYIPDDGKAEEARVSAAVKDAGVQGVLITRFVRVDVNTQVTSAYPPVWGMGYYGGYAGAWGGYTIRPGYADGHAGIGDQPYGVDQSHLLCRDHADLCAQQSETGDADWQSSSAH
jgi:hypothetical protein